MCLQGNLLENEICTRVQGDMSAKCCTISAQGGVISQNEKLFHSDDNFATGNFEFGFSTSFSTRTHCGGGGGMSTTRMVQVFGKHYN